MILHEIDYQIIGEKLQIVEIELDPNEFGDGMNPNEEKY